MIVENAKPLLRRISLRGWRSFDWDNGIDVDNLGRLNLIIGPNNVGKTNLGRFLVWLRAALQGFTAAPVSLPPVEREPAVGHKVAEIKCAIAEADFNGFKEQPIEGFLEINGESFSEQLGSVRSQLLSTDGYVRVNIRVDAMHPQTRLAFMPMTVHGEPLYKGLTMIADGSRSYVDANPKKGNQANFGAALANYLAKAIFDVKPLRDFARTRQDAPDRASFDGGTLHSELNAASKGKRAAWLSIRDDLERWLGVLLGEKIQPRLDVADSIRISFQTGSRLQLHLEDLGSGVAEVLMLLAFMRLRRDESAIVVLDEPEAHLHPSAAVELIRIVANELPRQQLLIATHSTSVIDAISSDWRLYKASMQQNGATAFTTLDTHTERLALASELGLRASQLFLAKVTIWVEGPSDAVYVQKLISCIAPNLLPGRDFGFAFYGGASMAHLSFDPEDVEALQNLVKLSCSPILIADRDRSTNDVLRAALQRLIETIKDSATAKVFVTPGREIENCVLPAVLQTHLRAIAPKHVRIDGRQIQLKFPSDLSLSPNAAFDEQLTNAIIGANIEVSGKEKTIRDTINKKKVSLSQDICSKNADAIFTEDALVWGNQIVAAIRAS